MIQEEFLLKVVENRLRNDLQQLNWENKFYFIYVKIKWNDYFELLYLLSALAANWKEVCRKYRYLGKAKFKTGKGSYNN